MATVDSIDAHSLLQSMASLSYDGSRLIDMACIAFAGVTLDQIAGLREAYTTTVAALKRDNVRAQGCDPGIGYSDRGVVQSWRLRSEAALTRQGPSPWEARNIGGCDSDGHYNCWGTYIAALGTRGAHE